MHSSTILLLALVASAAPALSVPIVARDTTAASDQSGAVDGLFCAPGIFSGSCHGGFRRQLARQAAPGVESGAGSKTNLVSDIVSIDNGIISGAQGIKNLFTRHEFKELLARQIAADAELVARSAGVDASGALNLPNFNNVCDVGCMDSRLSSLGVRRGDIEELLARDDTDASGALNLGKIVSTVASFLKRDEESQLLARDTESGAFSLGKFVNEVGSFFNKREEELLARDTDASGAFNLGKFDFSKYINEGRSFSNKREEELLSRDDDLYARSISQDIANFLDKSGFHLPRQEELTARGGPRLSGVLKFGRVAPAFGRAMRRENELFARSPPRAGHRHSTPNAHNQFHTARPSRVASGGVNRPASRPAARPAARSLNELD